MTCPKCGAHIGRFDLSPNCKSCGVNIMYFTQQRDLTRDAKRAELEYAGARIFVAKLKASFIGGHLQILRIVLTILCVGALVVPFGSVTVSLPLFEQKISVGAIGAYSLYSDGLLTSLSDFAQVDAFAPFMTELLAATAVFVLLAVLTLAVFVLEILSFINIRKTAMQLCVCSAAAIVLCAAGAAAFLFVRQSVQTMEYVSVQAGWGALVAAAAFAAMFTVNALIVKRDIQVKYKENDLLRSQTLKRVKSGEINIDELSLPVFETEEEKLERLGTLKDEQDLTQTGGAANEH